MQIEILMPKIMFVVFLIARIGNFSQKGFVGYFETLNLILCISDFCCLLKLIPVSIMPNLASVLGVIQYARFFRISDNFHRVFLILNISVSAKS